MKNISYSKFKILLSIIFIVSVLFTVSCKKEDKEVQIESESVTFKINNEFITNDKKGSFEIIEPLWWSVDIYNEEEDYEKTLKVFSLEQRYVFAIQWYISEVNNGGHDQFFYNSTGIVYKDALEGFKKIGLDENYMILKEAVSRMGGNPSLNRNERQDELDNKKPDFEDLDTKFYKTNPEEKLKKFILENKDAFYFEGVIDIPKP